MSAESKPTVVEALAAVMGEVAGIAKGRRSDQGYTFRGIDDALGAFHEPFAKHGIVVMPEVVERHAEVRETAKGSKLNVTHLRVRFTFYGPSGDSVVCVTQGEAQDSADKSTNKAMSAAFKYALFFVFCVPTDEPDADQVSEPASAPVDPLRAARAELLAVGESKGWDAQKLEEQYRLWSEGRDIREGSLEDTAAFTAYVRKQKAEAAA